MERDDYTDANRAAWNEVAPIHRELTFEQLRQDFRKPGHNTLDPVATKLLRKIGVDGKVVAQLACNNGRELLSIKNLGASACVGFDISEEFITQARELADAAGIEAEFVCCDASRIPRTFDRVFDLVFVSIGVLGWMPDLGLFLDVVARLLQKNGQLVIYEVHPILDMFEESEKNDPPTPQHSYFRTEPFKDQSGLDYIGKTEYPSKPMFYFHHKLSDLIQGLIDRHFRLDHFQEYDHDISDVFAHFAVMQVRMPLSFSLTARGET